MMHVGLKEAVYKNPHSTAAEKVVAEKKFRFVTDRVKETWTQKRNAELCELSAKDPSQFWKAFKAPQSNACPVELSAQFEAHGRSHLYLLLAYLVSKT